MGYKMSSSFNRRKLLASVPIVFSVLLGLPGAAPASAAQPAIFYSDLDSGPNTGGQGNGGAFVTVYGTGFGESQGGSSVTIGNHAAGAYLIWSDRKVVFQLGPAAVTGDIVVKTAEGASNGVPFTVRPGNIYLVATSGSDSGSGSVAAPWRTIPYALAQVKAGDTVYVRAGVNQTHDDDSGYDACLTIIGLSGAAGSPIALVAYPGESPTIGDPSECGSGIRTAGKGEHYWTVAGFNLRGSGEALTTYGDHDWRVVANDMSCPAGDDASACYETSLTTYLKAYGNHVHDAGSASASSLYQGVYFSTDSNHVDFGWNTIANIHGCRGLQVHSSPLTGGGASDPTGHDQFDIKIHDNIIHDTQCDGMILATVDPSKGAVEIYRNIIYNTGKGPNNPESSGSWSCIHVQGWTNNGPAGSGVIDVYNNTMYGCGTFANPPYQDSAAGILFSGPNVTKKLRIRNNIIRITTAVPYLLADDGNGGTCTNCSRVSGSNNLFFGSNPPPANSSITNSVLQDPLFLNAAGNDFDLAPLSPAANAGTPVSLTTDFAGAPIGPSYPIGAFAPGTKVVAPVVVTLSPASVTLQGGESQTFSALVSGSSNTAVTWSINPGVGSISAQGLYTAPVTITSPQSVTVAAVAVADTSRSASATITLIPLGTRPRPRPR